jgi:signal transduction histidine kinase
MLSRIDSGMQGTERVPVDLGELVDEIAGDANFEAGFPAHRVTVVRSDECTVKGSPEVLRSAVENVVRNAVRHTEEGTTIEITLRRQGSTALLQVRDHGAGVPESMLAEIFLPFRKAPPMNGNGAGLGLAITERAVRAHGGSVRAQNVSEGGLLVEMTFPVG